MVLDRSGSMAGDRLEQAKLALITLVDRLDPHDRFGLVTFDQHTDRRGPGRAADRQAGGQAGHRPGARRAARPTCRAATCADCRRRGASPAAGATVLLISDGHANAGVTDPVQLGDLARGPQPTGSPRRRWAWASATTSGCCRPSPPAVPATSLRRDRRRGREADRRRGRRAARPGRPGRVAAGADVTAGQGRPGGQRPPVVALPDGILIELGSFYAGETRKLIMTFDVPGHPRPGARRGRDAGVRLRRRADPGAAHRHRSAARERRPGRPGGRPDPRPGGAHRAASSRRSRPSGSPRPRFPRGDPGAAAAALDQARAMLRTAETGARPRWRRS